jgi:hypothetical protein
MKKLICKSGKDFLEKFFKNLRLEVATVSAFLVDVDQY